MKLQSISLENFRSYCKKQTIDLPPKGLVYVAGANGQGKSSLFEAIFWCLFGKTSRNLKAGSVANWKIKKGCRVCIHVTAYENKFKVERTWKPNLLTLNGREADQITLEKKLGVSPQSFIYSYFWPQVSESFLDLKPEPKLVLLSDILKLDLWEKASEMASLQHTAINGTLATLDGKLSQLKQTIVSLSHDVVDLKTKVELWDANQRALLANINRRSADTLDESRILTKQKAALEKEMEKVKPFYGVPTTELPVLKHEYREMEARIKKLSKLEGTCSECEQTIDKNHMEVEAWKLKQRLSKLNRKIKRIEKETENAARLDEGRDRRNESRRGKIHEIERRLSALEATRKAELREREEAKKENPYKEQKRKANIERLRAINKRDDLRYQLDGLSRTASHHKFWIKGFKEVRLLIVDSVLAQLEAEVNQTIVDLGLEGWSIKFNVEKENKSGTIRRGFDVLVLSPENEEAVPWESWSGGESQRLRLAGAMGFANLILDVSGDVSNFEMWDEPSNWLSEEGIVQMLQALADRAGRYNRTILLADHRAFDFGGFNSRIQISKTSRGSIIQE